MAIVKVCDVCGKQGRTPFTITENTGRVYDACSAKCVIDGAEQPPLQGASTAAW